MKKINKIITGITLSVLCGLGALVGIKSNNDVQTANEAAVERVIYLYTNRDNNDLIWWSNPRAIFRGSDNYTTSAEIEMTPTLAKYTWKVNVPNDQDYYQGYVQFRAYTNDGTLRGKTLGPADDKYFYKLDDNKDLFYLTNGSYDIFNPDQTTARGEWREAFDIPEEEGYYVVNSENGYKYAGAVKMNEGLYGDKAQTLQYHGLNNQYIKVRSFFNYTDTTYPSSGSGYKFTSDKDVNVYINENNEFLVEDYVLPPVEDGYYVFGTYNSTAISEYSDAHRMTSFVDEDKKYIALAENITANNGDIINVKNYTANRHSREIYITPNNKIDKSVFEIQGNNVVIKNAKKTAFDIFLVDDGGSISFFVDYYCVKVYNPITTVFFTKFGQKVSTQDFPAQLSYSNTNFYPDMPIIQGKYCTGLVYRDENCTHIYYSEPITESIHFYIKYEVAGYYYAQRYGDLKLMDTVNVEEDSIAEVTINYLSGSSSRFIFTYIDENGNNTDLNLADDGSKKYAYEEIAYDSRKDVEYSAIEFFGAGGEKRQYRVSIKKDGLLHIKEAGGLFCDDFINKIQSICDSTGANTNLTKLQNEWANQMAAYQEVQYKQEIIRTGFQYFKNPKNIFEKMMSKYYFIINKYGTDMFTNFIFPSIVVNPSNSASMVGEQVSDSSFISVIIVIFALTITTGLGLFVIKKKKENN